MKLTKVEENRIRKLLKTDPERGLNLAMEHFGPAVKWIAKMILGAEALQDVEECIAETFVRLWRSVAGSRSSGDGFDEEAGTTLYSYTCGIARHVAIDMVRRRPKETLVAEAIETDFDPDFAEELAAQENAIGFLLPAMEKSQLFRGVIADGILPRKTFSMGHAREKRYYLEGRTIK